MPPPALITTVHDPERRLLPGLERLGSMLACHAGVYACVTAASHAEVAAALEHWGVSVEVGPDGVPGEGQRRVLATAAAAGHDEVLLCDFDRWLHWAGTYPQELAELAGRLRGEHPEAWYVCLGRTARAHATHPVAQVLPETATNRALVSLAGRELDATAGASFLRRPAFAPILEASIETSKATDLEWPGLVWRIDPERVAGVFLEGLEFETADAYPAEIQAAGSLGAWMRETYDRPAVLRERLQLAADSITALIRVTGAS